MYNCYGTPTLYSINHDYNIYISCDLLIHKFPEILVSKYVRCESCGKPVLVKRAKYIVYKDDFLYYHLPYCNEMCIVAGEL